MAKLLRINMTDRSVSLKDLPEAYKLMGGRGLTSSIVYDEVDPTCHAVGPNNKLVFAPGIVTGTAAPTSARISVGAKSPLTGTIKESNAGSGWAPSLASMGIRALVIEGQPAEKGQFWMLHLSWDEGEGKPKIEFLPADEYLGRDLYEVYPELFERFGKVNVAGIGVAGEFLYGNSGVVFDDLEGRPSRYSGRGGMGAVMGSKGLKFIVVDRAGAPGVPVVDKDLLDQGRKKLKKTRTLELEDRWGSESVFLQLLQIEAIESGVFDEALAWFRQRIPEVLRDEPELDAGNIIKAVDFAHLLLLSGDASEANVLLNAIVSRYDELYARGSANYPLGIAKVEALTLLGQREEAISVLQELVTDGWRVNWRWNTEFNPNLASLQGDLQYQAIVNEIEADIAAQLVADPVH